MPQVYDGGWAFPHAAGQHTYGNGQSEFFQPEDGMSLRDWFAGKALGGMLGGVPGSHLSPANAAREAYAYADAMLTERAK